MEFCIITPTAGLERYAILSKTHLVLAHEFKDEYAEFYLQKHSEGDYIILDNGSYEGSPTFNVSIIDQLSPCTVVLPDYLLQPWRKTWHAAIHFLDMYFDHFSQVQWLYIPQSLPGDLNGFFQSYHEAVEDPRISWLGIPRALAYAISDNPLARVEFARIVRKDHPKLKLHAFGMVNGDVHELGYLAHAGVNSIDSSAPVWRGWCGCSIDRARDRGIWDEYGVPVKFDDKDHPSQTLWLGNDTHFDELIKHNLEACGVNTSIQHRG